LIETQIAELEARVSQLEGAIELLRSAAPDGEATASADRPFRILGSSGSVLLEVRDRKNDRSIAIFNADGQEVANLGCDGTGAGFLALRDRRGKLLAYITIELNGGHVLVSSSSGDSLVSIYCESEFGSGINISCPNGDYGVVVGASPDGGDLEVYRGHHSEPVVTAGTTPEGGVVRVMDLTGKRLDLSP
jgi:hypothetical protein